MKRRFYLPLLLLVGLTTAFANDPYRFTLGINAGLNFSSASIDPDPTANGGTKSGRTDFTAGFLGEYNLGYPYSIHAEVDYIQYGYKFERMQTIGNFQFNQTENTKVNYLEIPIFLQVHVSRGNLQPYGMFGPFFGFRWCAGEEFTTDFNGNVQTGNVDVRNVTSKIQFGVAAAAGVDVRMGDRLWFFGEARYNLGLNNIYKQPDNFTPPVGYVEPSLKYRAFTLRVGGKMDIF